MESQSRIKPGSLRSQLTYEPQELRFGTSGRRGDVVHLTQLEIYINALAELEYLLSLPVTQGGIVKGDPFYIAYDLRPSSTRFVAEQGGRGEIAQAIVQAIREAGLQPVNVGAIPTPALTYYALEQGKGSMMITGSHIPFDRNGYKTNRACGELMKTDEQPIQGYVQAIRQRIYDQPYEASLFNQQGCFKTGHQELPKSIPQAGETYLRRYTDFFADGNLEGLRLLVYQHSAVGRDLLVELLRQFGAEIIPAGRRETFVPIDTENIDEEQLQPIRALVKEAFTKCGPIDAVISTDGDSDRPLIVGVEPSRAGTFGSIQFYSGDLVGMITAEYLGADAVVVPISCNDAIDRGPLQPILEPKTRIGSPYVIAGMQKAAGKGRHHICGWEANGGFLTGTDLIRKGRCLKKLPTRDAILPILSVLFAMQEQRLSMASLFSRLPKRFSRSALLKRFPRSTSMAILRRFSPPDASIKEVRFTSTGMQLWDEHGQAVGGTNFSVESAEELRQTLSRIFQSDLGFGTIQSINYIDGIRIYFAQGEIVHVRPSGNADELRIYAVADTQSRAEAIAAQGIAEPDGLLRQMEKMVQTTGETLQTFHGNIASHEPAWEQAIAQFQAKPSLLPLTGVVQHYDWGGYAFIPSLLGIENTAKKPYAELWLGVHPKAPAQVQLGEITIRLDDLLERAAETILGPTAAARFQRQVPYLLKVLDARQMLSLQAHPSKSEAEAGYRQEEQAGLSLTDPARNYKDCNHKPEVQVALTDFWMLHGFRRLDDIRRIFEKRPQLQSIMPGFGNPSGKISSAAASELLRTLYQQIMSLPQGLVDNLVEALLTQLRQAPITDKDQPDFWVLRAAEQFPLPGGHYDRGLLVIYLMNVLHLQPGQSTFQLAGTLHAYLEGVNIELMANSDNVLRGGLTTKHVAVDELMRLLHFTEDQPTVLTGESISPFEKVYRTPAEEFELSRIDLPARNEHYFGPTPGVEILLVVIGAAIAHCGTQTMPLPRGSSVLVPAGLHYTLQTDEGAARLFKAAIPQA